MSSMQTLKQRRDIPSFLIPNRRHIFTQNVHLMERTSYPRGFWHITKSPHGLAQHDRIDPDVAKAKASAKRKQWESDVELSERWSRLKAQSLGAGNHNR